MKKQLFYVIFLGIFSQGCKECEEKVKIRRTVNKTISVSYNFNTTGESTNSAAIYASELYEIFDITDGEIEKIDVSGISLSGEIDKQQNTALLTKLTAQAHSSTPIPGIPTNAALLLNETKLIKVSETNLATDLVGTAGAIPTYTFNNAINSLNPVGLKLVQGFFARSLVALKLGVNHKLNIEVNSSVPPNQRLVGTVYLRLAVSVTYTQCESMPIGLFATDEKCD